MMRLGVSSWCFRNERIPRALERVASLGIRYVELFANHFHLDPRLGKPDVPELTRSLKENGLEPLSLHMPFAGIRISPSDPPASETWLALVRECFGLVEALAIPNIVVHPQFLTSDPGDEIVVDVAELVKREVFLWAGRSGTQVLVENLPSYLFPSYWRREHFRSLLEEDSGLRMCFDVSHCICSGLDLLEEIRTCLPLVGEIHLSDNMLGSGADLHLPLGQGQADWQAFFALLKNGGFGGDLILEIDGGKDPVEGIGASIRLVRELLGEK